MSQLDRKALIRGYKDTPLPAGIFAVRNRATGRSLIGSTPNLPGMLNRQRFQLESGGHPSAELQADWNELGPEAFEFEVLDRLEPPSDEPGYNPAEDLGTLKSLWLEKIASAGGLLYREAGR